MTSRLLRSSEACADFPFTLTVFMYSLLSGAIEVDTGSDVSVWVPSESRFANWYRDGGYEMSVVDWVSSVLAEGDRVCDVGAHVGYHTFRFAQHVGRRGQVIAFEADWRAARLLRHGVAMNRQDNVTVHPWVVGSSTGRTDLHIMDSGISSVLPPEERRDELFGNRSATKRAVPCTTLDRYFKSRPFPNLVKIDVEGTELAVLRGMEDTLKCGQPHLIVDLHGNNNRRVVNFLRRRQFDIDLIRTVGTHSGDRSGDPSNRSSGSLLSTVAETIECTLAATPA